LHSTFALGQVSQATAIPALAVFQGSGCCRHRPRRAAAPATPPAPHSRPTGQPQPGSHRAAAPVAGRRGWRCYRSSRCAAQVADRPRRVAGTTARQVGGHRGYRLRTASRGGVTALLCLGRQNRRRAAAMAPTPIQLITSRLCTLLAIAPAILIHVHSGPRMLRRWHYSLMAEIRQTFQIDLSALF
jgi:hypothetical protein